jgi:hypothetical protein
MHSRLGAFIADFSIINYYRPPAHNHLSSNRTIHIGGKPLWNPAGPGDGKFMHATDFPQKNG